MIITCPAADASTQSELGPEYRRKLSKYPKGCVFEPFVGMEDGRRTSYDRINAAVDIQLLMFVCWLRQALLTHLISAVGRVFTESDLAPRIQGDHELGFA